MSTTIKDFGRHSERFGDIGFYYAFPIKFWFGQHMIKPEDVLTWCQANCKGYYKVVGYTHNSSVRTKFTRDSGDYEQKVIYVDKIYLQSDEDAALIKLFFEVKDQQVKRPNKMKRKMKKRRVTKAMKAEAAGGPVSAGVEVAPVKTRKPRAKKTDSAQLALV